ncbi:GNAT family N-acetyltransferase [Winogradskyella ursingii]|uniref:GNAT family N-acetyltransferase n=1 Tax=Winogradskyella ursingii TaxID=2686079 RepID=UPI0015CE660E|nr:GNAT family N-acetyltransferase [Winogradskyella ursingii]
MKIIKANIDHLENLVPLFDGYRVFYRQPSDLAGSRHFLLNRFKNKDSVIFMAYDGNRAVGFTQLFHSFSSVSMQPIFVLNDLFIDSNYRNQGIGEALINRAKELAKDLNYKGISIQTETDNRAQYLYQRLGFEKDVDLHFFWKNS